MQIYQDRPASKVKPSTIFPLYLLLLSKKLSKSSVSSHLKKIVCVEMKGRTTKSMSVKNSYAPTRPLIHWSLTLQRRRWGAWTRTAWSQSLTHLPASFPQVHGYPVSDCRCLCCAQTQADTSVALVAVAALSDSCFLCRKMRSKSLLFQEQTVCPSVAIWLSQSGSWVWPSTPMCDSKVRGRHD